MRRKFFFFKNNNKCKLKKFAKYSIIISFEVANLFRILVILDFAIDQLLKKFVNFIIIFRNYDIVLP